MPPCPPRRAGTLAARAVAVLVLLGLLAVPPGPSYAAGTGSPGADVVRGGLASPEPFVVVDHNVERRQSAVDLALREAARTRAPVVTLQEVCWWQAKGIWEAHPSWTVGWKPDMNSGHCRRSGAAGLFDNQRRDSGLVAIWTGGPRGVVSSHTYGAQGASQYQAGAVCVTWRATGTTRHACSTHLLNAAKFTDRRGAQVRQARELKRLLTPWIQRRDLVVVGGDFNAAPGTATLDPMYAVHGRGAFHEAAACPGARHACRRSRGATHDGGRIKLDYVFFSADRLPRGAPHGLMLLPSPSDHHLLTGWALLDLRGR